MWWSNTITTIDIWSSKIRTVVWYFNNDGGDGFHILWVGMSSSNAMRKGNILDMDEFKSNLDKSLEEAERMAWEQVSWAYISFNSSSFEVLKNKWVVAVSWGEITDDDVDRALDMSKNGVDLPNKEVLKVIPEKFIVDLEEWIKNPVWMSSRKLEVVANIFSMNLNILNNIKKAVTDIWIEVFDIYPNLLSAPEWVLTKRQKELWVVCVDIWASTTWVSVYEDGSLKFSGIIPLGWDNITNDIALGLRISTLVAEKVKLNFAELYQWSKDDFYDKEIDFKWLDVWEEWSFSLFYLSKIVTARYEEILYFVREEIKKAWKDWMLPEWAICVWWWVKMKWFVELCKKTLKLPAFVGWPISKDELSDASINDPVFASVIWTMILSNKYSDVHKVFSLNVWWFFASIWKIFKKLIP